MYKLEQMLKNDDQGFYEKIGENKKMAKVNLMLPKFKLESEISLVKPLKELGIEKIFESGAQLRGISEKPLKVKDAIQKVFIEVDEAGSEGSAGRSPSQKEDEMFLRRATRGISFVVDHPFLFFVRDLHTGLLLFQGRVVEPPDFV